MAYVVPNTNVRLLANCPLDANYDHTIYFSDLNAQTAYFQGLTSYTLTAQEYQRVNDGKMRVKGREMNLLWCNYLMFQNTTYGAKWFYAFVTDVKYINNEVTELTYEIDVMQTWFFNYNLMQCFVEREHTASDALGANTVPENLEYGSTYNMHQVYNVPCSPTHVAILVTELMNTQPIQGTVVGGVFCGLGIYIVRDSIFTDTGLSAINDILSWYENNGKSDAVIAIYQFPNIIDVTKSFSSKAVTIPDVSKPSYAFNGYVPKNNKLYTYPYVALCVDNAEGGSATFHIEDFNPRTNITFDIYGQMSPSVGLLCVPRHHRTLNSDWESGLSMTNFPKGAWKSDVYKTYLATAGIGVATSLLGTAISGITTGNFAGMALGGANTLLSTLGQSQIAKIAPDQMHGQLGASDLYTATINKDYTFYYASIKAEYARMIDDYFTRYGYACNRLKTPNRNVRPHWTFTKTKNCCIKGSLPPDAADKICGIYDKGVTFWRNGSEIGNFNLNNTV